MPQSLIIFGLAATTVTLAAAQGGVPLNIDPAAVSLVHPSHHAELLADAADRSSLLLNTAEGESPSGFIKGRFTLSDGGPNLLTVGGFLQTRYLANFRDSEDNEAEDSFTHGFQTGRARVRVGGHVWDKRLTFVVSAEFGGGTGSGSLRDSEIRYTFDNKLYVRAGQYKLQFTREELVSPTMQLTVDRSLENSVFTLSRSSATGLGWTGERLRLAADIHDGALNRNTPFDSRSEADFALATRIEYLASGTDFKRFDDFTSFKDSPFAALLGAAVDYETYGDTGPGSAGGAPDLSEVRLTADGSLEGNGWNAFGAIVFRAADPASGASEDASDLGYILQGGFFLTDQVELFARYDAIVPDYNPGPETFQSVTTGLNYYISPRSHAAKITADVVFYIENGAQPGTTTPFSPVNRLNLLQGDEALLRIQWQVLF